MTHPHRLVLMGASLCLSGCAEQSPPFPYPPAVMQVGEQQRYKTALWSVSTSFLDSTMFWQPPGDSVWRTLEGLVSLEQRLVKLERGAGTTCFRFAPVDRPGLPLWRLWNNCLRYGPPAHGLRPLVAVWVNQHDGRVDSVLDIHNIRSSPGPVLVRENGRVTRVWQADARIRLFNTDQPFKAAFLRANRNRLPYDLRLLCQEKGIIR